MTQKRILVGRASVRWALAVVIAASASVTAAGSANARHVSVTSAAARTGVYWPGRSPNISYNSERPALVQKGFEPNPEKRFGSTFVAIGSGLPSPELPAIAWNRWGSEPAIGTGSARIGGQNARGPIQTQQVNLQLTMSGIASCGGAYIYTTLSVGLAAGAAAPTDWDIRRAEGIEHRQCWPIQGCPEGTSACTVQNYDASGRPFPRTIRGKLRFEAAPFSGRSYLYRMRFIGWGSQTTIGVGLISTSRLGGCDFNKPGCLGKVYPVRYKLSNPKWCTGAVIGEAHINPGLNYTGATVEAFGNGGTARTFGQWWAIGGHYQEYVKHWSGLLRDIGRPGVKRYVVGASLLNLRDANHRLVKTGCIMP